MLRIPIALVGFVLSFVVATPVFAHPRTDLALCRDPRDPARAIPCSSVTTVQVAMDPPPPPPPPPPLPAPSTDPIPWTMSPNPSAWTPAVSVGPTATFQPDLFAMGFSISVGFRRMHGFRPLPAVSGILLGNEMGLELAARLQWVVGAPEEETLLVNALTPVFRILTATSRISIPSVLGMLLPEIGITQFTGARMPMRPELNARWDGVHFRWSYDVRAVLLNRGVLMTLGVAPSMQVVIPFAGVPAHLSYGATIQWTIVPLIR